MAWSHTSPRVTSAKNANQYDPRASVDAESARNDLPRAPYPQDILKVRPLNSLDYRAHYSGWLLGKIFESGAPIQ